MEQAKKVTLSDIAAKLNISVVTVSKALSNKEGVGDELRKQIKELAAEMGYKTKKTAVSTENGKITGNIGILIPNRFFSQNYSFYWYLFNFVSTELLNRNYYSIMELLSDKDEEECNIPRLLQDNKVDGLIILGQTNDKYLETTMSGPHRDRINFVLDKKLFVPVASTGQCRLISLLLRVAQSVYFTRTTGLKPVLLMDDVLLELDPNKRAKLTAMLPEYDQLFCTFLPGEPYERYMKETTKIYHIENGEWHE